MRKRDSLLIHMEILSSLIAEPMGPTRLAQACNVNYGRIAGFTGPLLEKGLIRTEVRDGQEVFAVTDEGYRVYADWVEIWRRLPLGVT